MTAPAYVDAPVPEPALRREHAIASVHEPAFVRAFLRISKNIYDSKTKRRLREGIRQAQRGEKTLEEVVNIVQWFDPNDPLAAKRWELFGTSLEQTLEGIVTDAGEREVADQGWDFRFEVQKQRSEAEVEVEAEAGAASVLILAPVVVSAPALVSTPALVSAPRGIPINPFSIRWIRMKAAARVVEISDQQKELLREILADGFEQGQRPDVILKEIERVVGLTSRERTAVARRRTRLLAVALRKLGEEAKAVTERAVLARVERKTDRYASSLLRKRAQRIARTETIDAYSQGLDDSWLLAKEQGFIEADVLQEWVEIAASERTCKICRGLGGPPQRVPVGEPFVSEFIGEVWRPPAHPQCRCTRVLVFDNDDEELARADRTVLDARNALADRTAAKARALAEG